MSTQTPCTQEQIMLCLAYLAYTDESLPPSKTLDVQVKKDLTLNLSAHAATPLPPVAGAWDIVWGPVCYSLPLAKTQDNMMYVVRLIGATGIQQYAVAIRGTNPPAVLDWLVEDLIVAKTAAWPGADGARTSLSTRIALDILLLLTDPDSGQTVVEFLTSAMTGPAASQASVCCTGHSLGGTLAQVLSLWLRDNQSRWDPDALATVTTINFAGPTAGNAAFAAHFDQLFSYTTSALPFWVSPQFPGSSASSYADCVRTSLDIAPRAWNATTLAQIPTLYESQKPPIVPPLGTTALVHKLIDATQAIGYVQTQAGQQVLAGSFSPRSGALAFADEAEFQHHNSYPLALNVPALLLWQSN